MRKHFPPRFQSIVDYQTSLAIDKWRAGFGAVGISRG